VSHTDCNTGSLYEAGKDGERETIGQGEVPPVHRRRFVPLFPALGVLWFYVLPYWSTINYLPFTFFALLLLLFLFSREMTGFRHGAL
jgi:hypothetical protein